MTRNLTDEERDRIFKQGNFKTVIVKDDRYTEHHAYVIAFVKNGTKYLHGIIYHKDDQDGRVCPNYSVTKVDKSKAKIVDGARWDLVDRACEFISQKFAHQQKRERFQCGAEYDLRQEMSKALDAEMTRWDEANPPPTDPFDKELSNH
jgi:hypothetical protein